MIIASQCSRGGHVEISGVLPDLRSLYLGGAATAVPPEAPTKAPTTPDVETEPNTVPHRNPVPEPDVAPCDRPDTSCPVHR